MDELRIESHQSANLGPHGFPSYSSCQITHIESGFIVKATGHDVDPAGLRSQCDKAMQEFISGE